MKLRIFLTLAVILTLSTGSAMAQSDPFGNMDTVIMVPAVVPEAGVSDQLQLDLYVYNDETLLGATAGFTWDNSKLQMDSAVGSALVESQFDLGTFYFQDNDLALTNANQQFLFGGASLFSSLTGDPSSRRLWASYYFTASGWTSTDAATIDTLTFNNGSEWIFSSSGGDVIPYWAGAVTIGNQVQPSNLVVDPNALSFTAIQFGANPDNQNILISSDNEPLTFSTDEDIPWLTLSPTTGTTEQTVVAAVDITGLAPGLYEDTIIVSSAGADNSPVIIPVTLNIAEPPLVLETAPDTLSFEAIEDGANPAIQRFYVDEEFDRPITYSVTENSPWISTDKVDGTTPDSVGVEVDITGVAPGDYLDSIVVSSLDAANDPQVVYVALTVTPRPRALAVSPDTLFFNVAEDGPVSDGQWFNVTELGGDAISFEVTGTNAFVNVDDSLGVTPDSVAVTVNPGDLAPGSYFYTLQVESAEATNSPQPVVVAVDVAPRVRQLVATPDALNFTATEGGTNPADQTFDVEEILGDNTLYLVGATPAWISIAPGGGTTPNTETVSIDITGVTAGTYVDTVTIVGDEELLPVNGDSVIITLTVNPAANQPPVLDSIADQSTDEGVQLVFGVTASDPDGTTPTLSTTDLPVGALFTDNGDGSGTFDWTPTFDQAGVYTVWFYASDGQETDSQEISITVFDVNRAPAFVIAPRDTTIDECGTVLYVITATDPDGDALTANAMPLAANMTFEDSTVLNTWVFYFTPDTTQAGTYPLTAWVSDGMDTTTVAFTITVEECETQNEPPVLDSIPDQMVDEGAVLNFTVTASDPEGTTPVLTAVNLPTPEVSFIDNGDGTATFDWTPSFEDAGVYETWFIASDGSLRDSQLVTITVNNVNRAPVFGQQPSDTTIDECGSVFFPIVVADPDGESVTIMVEPLEPGMAFVDSGNGSAYFSFAPDTTQAGTYNLTAWATDGTDTTVVPFTIVVEDCVIPPDTARLQVIHNAADPAAASVDIWVNGTPYETDFAFREATGFRTVPAGVDLEIGVAPAGSSSQADSIASFTVNLAANGTYIVFANGVLDPTGFEANPDGRSIAFTLFTKDSAREAGQNGAGNVDFFALHGSTDAPTVDVIARGVATLVDNAAYGDMTAYTSVPAAPYILDVTPGDDTTAIVASFDADLSGLGGGSAAVFASGFLTPANDQNGPAFGLFAALANGTVVEFPMIVEPDCVDMILSDTTFTWFDTVGTPDNPNATLNISSSGDPFCFSISETLPEPPATFFVSDSIGCTPADVMLSYDKSGLAAGTYTAVFAVLGDSTVCDPNPQFFTVTLELIDTTSALVDTLLVETVVGTPGSQVEVPISFINHCDLYGVNATLGWASDMIMVDSVSFMGSDLADFDVRFVNIDNDSNVVVITATEDLAGTPVAPGFGLAATMYVSISASADSGDFYAIDLGPSLIENPTFLIDCGTGVQQTLPDFVPGGVIVEDLAQFTCGYVVDTAGNPIEGATVELWPDFPGVGPEMTTMSDTTGYFQFNDVFASPYDIWAYKEGYYPGLVEQVNFGETGIMVTLTPVPSITATNEFVFFYCGTNTWFGEVLPVGSVIDAYDPDGVHCGTWFVDEAGSYGFMPVYRDDQFTPNVDEGAEPGDLIRFHVNGIEALAFGNNTWTQDRDQWEVCLEAGEFTKSCDLMAGWNLISWSIDTETDDIETVLAPIADHVEVVMGFEQGGLAWDPALPQFSTLWMVDHYSGYWIKVDSAVTLEIAGAAVAAATPIPLTAGWNLVSYLPEITLATEVALSSIENDLIVALGYDGSGLTFLPGDTLHNTLTDMAPCNGYWVKVDNAGTLTYPGPGPAVAPHNPRELGTPVAKTAPGVTPTRSWMNLYAHNLTVDGEQVTAGATVEAYTIDGTKIGAFSLKQNGLFGFMPVYADDPSTSDAEGVKLGETFTLTVNGVATEETFEFTGHGDKLEITGLTAKGGDETLPGTFSLSQNYPNPFNPTTTIEFSLPAAGKATLEVFNVLGKRVATVFDGPAEAGVNRIEWNATDDNDQKVASGIYFYRLTADNYNETKKMILLK